MTRTRKKNEMFFSVLAQALFEAQGAAANQVKNLARWPRDVTTASDKAELVRLLREAAESTEDIEVPW